MTSLLLHASWSDDTEFQIELVLDRVSSQLIDFFFSHIQSKTNALQATIDTLQGRLGAQEAKINDLNNELGTVQKHYDEQCQGNDDLKGQLADLQSQLKDTQRQKGNS